jgi:hypothetical protein
LPVRVLPEPEPRVTRSSQGCHPAGFQAYTEQKEVLLTKKNFPNMSYTDFIDKSLSDVPGINKKNASIAYRYHLKESAIREHGYKVSKQRELRQLRRRG